ncbi:MAG: DUF192 domain-containing protein [Devosiaceae bacterium]|nr:DUF192 domain-containing protein [Devosiaceae bacterium]
MRPHLTSSVQIFVRIFAAFAVVFALAACSGQEKLVLHTKSGNVSISVDIVDTNESRAKGLMFVQSMAPDKGMLFDFKETRVVSFWMRNTFIPLDMVFIAADGEILNIHANARPHDQTGISSQVPVRFVLEINAGRAEAIGLAVGDKVSHPIIPKN